jgi:hypothetical protein
MTTHSIEHYMAMISKRLEEHRALNFALIVLMEVQGNKFANFKPSTSAWVLPKAFDVWNNKLHIEDLPISSPDWPLKGLQGKEATIEWQL